MPQRWEHRVTLIEGDGVGPEVIRAATEVVAAAGVNIDWDRQVAGAAAVKASGTPIPDELIRSIRKNHVALKGPVATRVGRAGFRSVNVALRKFFDLYANVRPIRNLPGIKSAFEGVDLVVIRENTEDLYAGIEHRIAPGVVESVKVITAKASRRIAKFAFAYAERKKRRKVTAVHKANIMKVSDGLFLSCARQVAKRYPHIKYEEMIVDNACMQLVRKPAQFDVLLLENLYGDIISDLCAGLVGGLGVVPGANLGSRYAIFEAVHGTAPDIAGKNLADPAAAILSAVLMLRHLGKDRLASRIQAAVQTVVGMNRYRTRDLGGHASTAEMTRAIIRILKP
ncbi:MAG: isocitrate dehydrogenase (NAD(+)) [Candidatus Binatia bacterium]